MTILLNGCMLVYVDDVCAVVCDLDYDDRDADDNDDLDYYDISHNDGGAGVDHENRYNRYNKVYVYLE